MGSGPWVDPGAEAIDAVDGNVTDRMSVRGLEDVNTDIALGPDDPYVVTYEVRSESAHWKSEYQ